MEDEPSWAVYVVMIEDIDVNRWLERGGIENPQELAHGLSYDEAANMVADIEEMHG